MRKTIICAALAALAWVPATAYAYGGEPAAKTAGAVITDPARNWDELWSHALIDIVVIGVFFSIGSFYLIFKYRRKSDDQEGAMPKISRRTALAWAIVPTFLFLADDFYLAANGWKLWNDQRRAPEGALEVQLTGQMYSWDFDYGNGVHNDVDDNGRPVFIVPQGRPVVLRMRSEDVIHSFFMPDFRIKEDLMPGRVTYLWFYPREAGEHVLTCTEYCGMGHSTMWGKVKVVPPAQFEAFLKARAPAQPAQPGGKAS